jgi:hypothetical protein
MEVLEEGVRTEGLLDELAQLRVALVEPSPRRDSVRHVHKLGLFLSLGEELDKVWEELRLDWKTAKARTS